MYFKKRGSSVATSVYSPTKADTVSLVLSGVNLISAGIYFRLRSWEKEAYVLLLFAKRRVVWTCV